MKLPDTKLCLLALLFLFSMRANGHFITLYNINTDNFPTMSGKLIIADDKNVQITDLSAVNIKMFENNLPVKIQSVSCEKQTKLSDLSAVLVIDHSGSMYGENLNIAKKAAIEWVNAMSGNSECAVTAFDSYNQFATDFTRDKTKLAECINNLEGGGGTDFDAALLDPAAGGLIAAEKGKYKRIIIMLTDGESSSPSIELIKQKARELGVTIYMVFLKKNKTESLDDIATSTGGRSFVNIRSADEASAIYKTIYFQEANSNPCTISWESNSECNRRAYQGVIRYQPSGDTNIYSYVIDQSRTPGILIEPMIIRFTNAKLGVRLDTSITVTAINKDFEITGTSTDESEFTIEKKLMLLHSGDSIKLKVSYIPMTDNNLLSKITIHTDQCDAYSYLSAYYSYKKATSNKFRVVAPNGGELLAAGCDTTIKWSGCLPNDKIILEFSPDSGKTWQNINDTATNFVYSWNGIPKLNSKNCLIKASRNIFDQPDTTIYNSSNYYLSTYDPNFYQLALCGTNGIVDLTNFITDNRNNSISLEGKATLVKFSDDGYFLGIATDKVVNIYDSQNGNSINSIVAAYTSSIGFGHKGNIVAIGYKSGLIEVYDIISAKLLAVFADSAEVMNIIFTLADDMFYTSNSRGDIKCWKLGKPDPLRQLASKTPPDPFTSFKLTPNEKYLVYIKSNQNVCYLSTDSMLTERKFGPLIAPKSGGLCFSQDGRTLAVMTGTNIYFFETNTWKFLNWVGTGLAETSSAELFFNDNDKHIVAVFTSNNIYRLNPITGNIEKSKINRSSQSVRSIAVSNDGNYFALGYYNSSVEVYDIDKTSFITSFNNSGKYGSSIFTVEFSPNGELLAFGGDNNDVYICSIPQKKLLTVIDLVTDIKTLTFYRNDTTLFVGCWDGTIRAFNPYTGKEIKKLNNYKYTVNSLATNPVKNQIAAGFQESELQIWDVDANQEILAIDPKASITKLKYNKKGTLLGLCGSCKGVKIYDAVNFNYLYSIDSLESNIKSFDISPGGLYMAIASGADITLWDMATHEMIRTLKGHKEDVNSVVYGDNDKTIFSGADDGLGIRWYLDNKDLRITDVSDSCFEIARPALKAVDIDMGGIAFGKMKDSVITNYFTNSGKVDCFIKEVRTSGPTAQNFNIVLGGKDVLLPVGKSADIEIEFNPKTVGESKATLEIVTNDTIYKRTIKGVSYYNQIELCQHLIDFGKVIIGMEKDTLVDVVRNKSQLVIEFGEPKLRGPDSTQFLIDSGGARFTMSAQGSHKMKLRFKPYDIGRTSGKIELPYEDTGTPALAYLYAEALPVPKPKVIANNPLCQGDDLIMFAETIEGVSYHWIGPDKTEYDGGSLRINNAQPWHSGRYIVFANVKNYWSDTMTIDVSVNTRYILPADSAMKLVDSASKQGNGFLLTDAKPWQSGAVWLKYKFTLDNDFISSFKFKVSKGSNGKGYDNSEPGGDGFAFVFRKDYGEILGSQGESIGYGGIPASMAIEIDLHKNYYDINGNHIAVLFNKDRPNSPVHDSSNTLADNPNIPVIQADSMYYVKIIYNAQPHTLFVYLDKDTTAVSPVIQLFNLNLRDMLGLDNNSFGFVGITASTGDAYEQHWIYDWVIPCSAEILNAEQREDNAINIYPNPARESLYFRNDDDGLIIYAISLCNSMGQTIRCYELPVNSRELLRLSVSGITPGVYYLKIKSNKGTGAKIIELN